LRGRIVALLIGTSSKMNLTSTEAAAWIDLLVPAVEDVIDRELFVLLPFTSIWVARDRLTGSRIRWGAQDVHPEDAGAHTGDVSAPMLADLGCTYVEVGHHERRRDHGESDELVAAKVAAVQRWGMTAIVCVGEVRRAALDDVGGVLERQLGLLHGCDPSRLVVAYEPAWAIGVGARAASPRWVGQAHAAIRHVLAGSDGPSDPGAPTRSAPVIYGGSVGPNDAAALLAQSGVDGLFVGRSALDPRAFAAIVHTLVPPTPQP
jgi:triosephosphate isomerase